MNGIYQELRLDLIIQTVRRLEARIRERFTGRGLSRIAGDLASVAEQTGPILDVVRRPNLYLPHCGRTRDPAARRRATRAYGVQP